MLFRSDLTRWFSDQRERYRSGRLSTDRIALLETLPDWEWNPTRDQWMKTFELFQDWCSSHSPYRVPTELVLAGVNGKQWVQNQRTQYRAGNLPEERARLLETVPGWTWKVNEDSWTLRYDELVSRGISGVLPESLREWIQTQKKANSRGRLLPERRLLLESIPGWTWGKKIDLS